MTREEGLKQIDEATWELDEYGCLNLVVQDEMGRLVLAWLQRRPHYCDRGHLHLVVEMTGRAVSEDRLDDADSFPRYFFNFTEADTHTRTFLKWRLWKERVNPGYVLDEVWNAAPKVKDQTGEPLEM